MSRFTKEIPNISEIFYNKDRSIYDTKGDFKFHAQDNYSNLLIINLEEEDSEGSINLINFTPKNANRTYTTHWFYLDPIKKNRVYKRPEDNKPKVFQSYIIEVPNLVLQNNNRDKDIINTITVVRRYGFNDLGLFNSLNELVNNHTPNKELADSNAFAYVLEYENDNYGFYQVIQDIETNDYIWTKRDNVMNFGLRQKQYHTKDIITLKGFSNIGNIPNVEGTTTQALMNAINQSKNELTNLKQEVEDFEITSEETDTLLTQILKTNYAYFTISGEVKIDNNNNALLEKSSEGLYVKHDDTKVDQDEYENEIEDIRNTFATQDFVINYTLPTQEIIDRDNNILTQAKEYADNQQALDRQRIEDLELEKEDKSNKRTNLENSNHETYPTTQAVKDYAYNKDKVDGDIIASVDEAKNYTDNEIIKLDNQITVELNKKLEDSNIKGFVNDVFHDPTNHKLTFERHNDSDIVIDLPIEALIENISLDGNDLVLTYEDGTTTRVPLNTLLVGVVKEINGKTPNSSGVINLSYNDLNDLPSLFSGNYNDLTNKPYIPEKTSDLTNDSDFAKNSDVVPKTRKINDLDLSVDRVLTSQDIDYILNSETIFDRLKDTYRKNEIHNIINQLKTALGWSDSDLGVLENNDTYTVDLDYNFIILEEHLNGDVIPYQIVIDNMENVSYGNNITLNNGVLTYTGSEKVYLTGYKTDDKTKIDELSNELMAILGLKRDDLAELNKNDSYTYNKLYDYLLIREVNSSDSYLLDVNTGEIKSTHEEVPPNPNVSWEQKSLSGTNPYVVDVKYNAGGNYKVVPRVERMFLSEPPRAGNSLGVGELVNNNPGKYLVAINAGKYNISNPNFDINGPEGVLIIDGVIYEEKAHPNYHAIAFNNKGDVKFFKGINATEILNQGYTSATTGFHPVILDGNKMGAGYIDSPGGALTNALRQIIVGLKNGDYKVYSFGGGSALTFEQSRDIIYDNEPDVDFAYQLDGGGSTTTYVDDVEVYAAERDGLGRRVIDAIVWEIKEFVAGGIIDLDGNKITYNGNSKLEIVGIQSRPERQYQELKRDFNSFKQEVEGLFTTDYTGLVSGVNNIQLPSVVAKAPVRVGFKYEANRKNLGGPGLAGKEYLGNDVYRIYSEYSFTMDYNVMTGDFILNKNSGDGASTRSYTVISFGGLSGYVSFKYLSGSLSGEITSRTIELRNQNDTLERAFLQSSNATNGYVNNMDYLRVSFGPNTTFNNYRFRLQIEAGNQATDYEVPYIDGYSPTPQTNLRFTIDNTSMYIRGDRVLLDGEEVIYSGGKYFIKLNSDYLPMESSGMAISKPNERVLVENAMQEVMLYNDGLEVSEDYKIDELEVLTIINQDGTEVDLNINNAIITDTKITHPNISNGDLVYFTYKYQGTFPDVEYEILYYIHDKTYMSPDGSVWIIEKSVSNDGTISETAVKVE